MPIPVDPHAGPELTAARADRLRAALDDAGFDALLVTRAESVLYATGHRSLGASLAAVVTAERTLLVVPMAEVGEVTHDGWAADDVIGFGRFYQEGVGARDGGDHPDLAAALGAALSTVRAGRLAVEHAGLTDAHRAVLPADVVPADDWLLGVRAVKLPAEQALLRRAAELAEAGIEAALKAAAVGVTERELAAAVAQAMAVGGGEPRFIVATAGERTALVDTFPTDRPCRPGDLLRFDVGCVYHGYWSDIARTAVIGEPTDRQQRYYDALLAGVRAEFEAARPGAVAHDVFAEAVRTVEEGGGPRRYRRHHVGHTIGLDVYEQPVVAPDDATVLREGMVFCLETPYYELGWGGMMVEDTGAVTAQGFELFTSIDRSLRVIA
ncbi:M24 family metallopeptidase [Streptomyces sp. NPDC004752]